MQFIKKEKKRLKISWWAAIGMNELLGCRKGGGPRVPASQKTRNGRKEPAVCNRYQTVRSKQMLTAR